MTTMTPETTLSHLQPSTSPHPPGLPDRAGRRAPRSYAEQPMIIYWELTQACALACRHCRAEALPARHPLELSTAESRLLLKQVAAFGSPPPHLILTGGDPLQRPDLFQLIDEAVALGIRVSITPSATQNLTGAALEQLKAHGIDSLGLSLDGSTAARHDALRGVEGCFEWTARAARRAADLELPIQINTLVSAETADDLPAIYEFLSTLKIMRWSLFFLIAVGRGRVLQEVSPEQGEALMHWIYDISGAAPFALKTTEAPSYRRVALDRMRQAGLASEQIRRTPVYHGFGIRDGHGIMFISNTGAIYPAGFLPLTVGNVRKNDLAIVYRQSPAFQALHEPDRLKGKCGRCEHRVICGGSRARAYAYTGDPLESDPLCPYEPDGDE